MRELDVTSIALSGMNKIGLF